MTDNRTTERVDHPPRVREAIDELMREKDATDNRTTELLRKLLDERGVKYSDFTSATKNGKAIFKTRWKHECGYAELSEWESTGSNNLFIQNVDPEQAIAATLGKPMEKDLRLALDFMRIWISDDAHLGESEFSYELEKAEGLRRLEAVEQTIAATLGSEPPYDELLRCLENDWHIHASWDGLRKFWNIELTEEGVKLRDAAHAERTCHNTHENRWFKCSACGYGFTDLYAEDESDIDEQPRYCPNCGCKAVDA